jgi:hypothetical protein
MELVILISFLYLKKNYKKYKYSNLFLKGNGTKSQRLWSCFVTGSKFILGFETWLDLTRRVSKFRGRKEFN